MSIKIFHAGVVKTISLAGVGQINVKWFCQIPVAGSGVNRTLITMKKRRTQTCQLKSVVSASSLVAPVSKPHAMIPFIQMSLIVARTSQPSSTWKKVMSVTNFFLGSFGKNSLFNLSIQGRLFGIFGSRRQRLNRGSRTREFRSLSLISRATLLWLTGVSMCVIRNLSIRFAPKA